MAVSDLIQRTQSRYVLVYLLGRGHRRDLRDAHEPESPCFEKYDDHSNRAKDNKADILSEGIKHL